MGAKLMVFFVFPSRSLRLPSHYLLSSLFLGFWVDVRLHIVLLFKFHFDIFFLTDKSG